MIDDVVVASDVPPRYLFSKIFPDPLFFGFFFQNFPIFKKIIQFFLQNFQFFSKSSFLFKVSYFFKFFCQYFLISPQNLQNLQILPNFPIVCCCCYHCLCCSTSGKNLKLLIFEKIRTVSREHFQYHCNHMKTIAIHKSSLVVSMFFVISAQGALEIKILMLQIFIE